MTVAMNMEPFGDVIIFRSENYSKILNQIVNIVVFTDYTYI